MYDDTQVVLSRKTTKDTLVSPHTFYISLLLSCSNSIGLFYLFFRFFPSFFSLVALFSGSSIIYVDNDHDWTMTTWRITSSKTMNQSMNQSISAMHRHLCSRAARRGIPATTFHATQRKIHGAQKTNINPGPLDFVVHSLHFSILIPVLNCER